jgi:hypothetical protein
MALSLLPARYSCNNHYNTTGLDYGIYLLWPPLHAAVCYCQCQLRCFEIILHKLRNLCRPLVLGSLFCLGISPKILHLPESWEWIVMQSDGCDIVTHWHDCNYASFKEIFWVNLLLHSAWYFVRSVEVLRIVYFVEVENFMKQQVC